MASGEVRHGFLRMGLGDLDLWGRW
jgi:hypothetical protein